MFRHNKKELLVREALHIQAIVSVQNKNFTNVLKLLATNNTIERNKNQAKMTP